MDGGVASHNTLDMDDELEFYTDLALQETERWIQVVTRHRFMYEDDPRKSLENGQLLCELVNQLKPGSIKKVNRLPTPIAGLDNLNVFLEACRKHFQLKDSQLFDPYDLEDLSTRAIADDEEQLKYETERRLRNVAITVYWLGKAVKATGAPGLDFSAFSELVNYHSKQSGPRGSRSALTTISEAEPPSFRIVGDLDGSTPKLSHADSYGNILHLHALTPQGSYSEGLNQVSTDETSKKVEPEPTGQGSETHGPSPEHKEQEQADEMPGRFDDGRRHSYGGKQDSNYSMQESIYDEENGPRGDAQYKSNPNLNDSLDSRDEYDKFRYGSVDAVHNRYSSGESLESREYHSRQSSSSASGDFIPTRPSLRTSGAAASSADPLQFIKANQGNPLAVQAKITQEMMQTQKKVKPVLQEEEHDWHSNLSSWKMKMRRKSHTTHPHPKEPKRVEEDDSITRKKSKTFKEMMEERERRKSGGYNIYPFGEDDDLSRSSNDHSGSREVSSLDDRVRKEEPEPAERTRPRRRNYGFYQDVEEDEVFPKKDKDVSSKKPDDTGYSDWRKKHSTEHAEVSSGHEVGTRRLDNNGVNAGRYGTSKSEFAPPERDKQDSPQSKYNHGELWEKAERLMVTKGGKSPTDKSPGPAWSWERKVITEDIKDTASPWSKSDSFSNSKDTYFRNRVRDTDENKENEVKVSEKVKPWERSPRNWQDKTPDRDAESPSRTVRDDLSNARSGSFGSRSNKFDSIRTSFEKTKSQEEEDERLSSRRVGKLDTPSWLNKSSEDVSGAKSDSRWQRDNGNEFRAVRNVRDQWKKTDEVKTGNQRSSPARDDWRSQKFNTNEEFKDVSNVRNRWQKTEEESKDTRPTSEDWRNRKPDAGNVRRDWRSLPSNEENSSRNNWSSPKTGEEENNNRDWRSKLIEEDNLQNDFRSRRPDSNENIHKWRSVEKEDGVKQDINTDNWRGVGRSREQEFITQRVQEDRVVPEKEMTAQSAPPAAIDTSKKFMEKVIKINQKPNHPKGFGFTIKGGKELGTPIVVEKVSLGSAADVCELLVGDELISINGAEVGRHYRESVMHVIDKAVDNGQLELRIKRYLEEEEEDFDDDFEDEIKPVTQEHRGRDSPASVDSMNSEEERLEQQIMDDLELEAQREEDMEEQHQRTLVEEREQKPQPWRQSEEDPGDEDEDEPPPLPSAPPPVPNWSTFPSGTAPKPEDSFLDSSDLLPDTSPGKNVSNSQQSDQTFKENGDKPPLERMDSVTRLRTDILRRKSEFLGVNVEETEEYKKLQAEKMHDVNKKEENVWQKIENKEFIASTSTFTIDPKDALTERPMPVSPVSTKGRPLDDLWQHVETSTQGKNKKSTAYNATMGYRPQFDLEKQEREIIENLEREEAARKEQQRTGVAGSRWMPSSGSGGLLPKDQEKLRAWKSMEVLQAGGLSLKQEESIIPQRSRDMESAVSAGQLKGGRSLFNVDEEKRKMEDWNQEQERRRQPTEGDTYKVETTINLQEKFQQEQQALQNRFSEDLKKSEEAESQRRDRERKMLEKEIARQQEAEARFKEFEEKERQRREEEERKMKEDEEHRKKWEQEKRFLEGISAQTSNRNTPVHYPWSGSPAGAEVDINKENREREQKRQEEELRANQERLHQMEMERKLHEEQEAQQLKEKENQLRAKEERIKREAEQLRQEREQLQREKEESQRVQSLPASPYQHAVSQPTFAQSSVADRSTYSSPGQALYTPAGTSQYSSPYGGDQRYPYKNDHQEDKTPQFKIEIQTDPSKRVIMDRKPAAYDSRSLGYNFDVSMTTSPQAEKSPGNMPVIRKPLLLKKEQLTGPKPSSFQPKQSDMFHQRDLIEQNKWPGGREYSPPVATNRSMEEITVQRSVLNRRPGKFGGDEQVRRYSYAMEGSGSPLLSRDDVLKMNRFPGATKQESLDDSDLDERYRDSNTDTRFGRKSWHETTPPQSDIHPAYRPQDQNVPPGGPPVGTDSGPQPLGRRGLHNLSAPPRKQLLDQWVIPEDERLRNEEQKRQQKRSEIMRQQIGNTSDHWLVEEAERRRRAEQAGQDRLQKMSDRHTPTDMYGHPASEDGYRSHYDPMGSRYHPPTHIMEHVEAPNTDHRPSRPIPEAIKQTLLERVSSPRSPHGSTHGPPSPNYPYGGPSNTHYSHSAQSSMTSYSDDSSPRYPSGGAYMGSQPQLHHPPSSVPPSFYNSDSSMSSIHERAAPVPPAKPPRSMHLGNQGNPGQNHYQGSSPYEPIVAVSGRKKCSHCEQELGHGDAMIIESLGLSYHVQCFRCCVCHAPLGTGLKGADVRVRQGKLHCQNCYSNDEAWFS